MIYCRSCARYVDGERPYDSQLCCNLCGRVIEYHNFSNEPTFVKNAAGQSQLSGNFVRTIQSEYGASRERLLERVFDDMQQMRTGVGIGEDDELVLIAKRLYGMAVERNFTRGRRTQQVQASCLYYACREKMKPFLLIDFANYLNINVYELGAVYLQLCQVLYLADESNIQKQIDPSIFLPKFTNRLLDGGNKKVCNTARDILASMKRDWITTGRKPSGLCGAALYISALTHGLRFSKSDIVKIAHVCEATLTKRLIEFENTDSGSLTMEDFIAKKELQGSSTNKQGSQVSALNEVLCKHKNSGKPFAYGLCRSCYDEFMTISEGLEGGSDPPAFQLAERQRMAKASEEKNTSFERESQSPFMITAEKVQSTEPESVGTVAGVLGAGTEQAAVNECDHNKSPGVDFTNEASDGSDNFSDIDDLEVDGYLHNEEEKHYKKIIWEKMNWEYLEEQAAKEAAAAAAKEAFEANYKNCPKDLQGAQELAAAAAAAVAKSRKERQQKRAAEARNSAPRTAVEAAQQMLTKKRLSAKINLNVLKELFGDSVDPETPNKKRTESHTDDNDNLTSSGKKGHEQWDTFKKGNLEPEDYYDNKLHTGEACEDQLDYEIGNEAYG